MPIAPDPPFPKAAGNPIRSKDWNDLVTEAQRLDNAKVNRAGDAMSGPLTIAAALGQAALGVGTATPAARLHVVDPASPAVLRVQSTASFGAARVELWSNPQGSGTEWRPGYIQSFDLGNFTGGLSFVTNGQTNAQRTGSVEAMRLTKGRVGIGVTDPAFILDVGDRIRLREGPGGTAGLWLYQNATATQSAGDRAFVGIAGETTVGLWGNTGASWGLVMDTSTGNLGVRGFPAGSGGAALSVNGRIRDGRAPTEAIASGSVSISTLTDASGYTQIPNMSQSLNVPVGGWFYVRFRMNGVQLQVSNLTSAHGHGDFRLLLDGNVVDSSREEFHSNGWELRGVSLERLLYLSAGPHTLAVQWQVGSDQARGPVFVWPALQPEARATLTGCWYPGDNRSLVCIEL